MKIEYRSPRTKVVHITPAAQLCFVVTSGGGEEDDDDDDDDGGITIPGFEPIEW